MLHAGLRLPVGPPCYSELAVLAVGTAVASWIAPRPGHGTWERPLAAHAAAWAAVSAPACVRPCCCSVLDLCCLHLCPPSKAVAPCLAQRGRLPPARQRRHPAAAAMQLCWQHHRLAVRQQRVPPSQQPRTPQSVRLHVLRCSQSSRSAHCSQVLAHMCHSRFAIVHTYVRGVTRGSLGYHDNVSRCVTTSGARASKGALKKVG